MLLYYCTFEISQWISRHMTCDVILCSNHLLPGCTVGRLKFAVLSCERMQKKLKWPIVNMSDHDSGSLFLSCKVSICCRCNSSGRCTRLPTVHIESLLKRHSDYTIMMNIFRLSASEEKRIVPLISIRTLHLNKTVNYDYRLHLSHGTRVSFFHLDVIFTSAWQKIYILYARRWQFMLCTSL